LGGFGVRVVGLASTGSRIRVRLAGIAPSKSARKPGGRAISLRPVRRLCETGRIFLLRRPRFVPPGVEGEAGAPVTVGSLPARGRPPQAAARRAGLEFVEKLLPTKLTSTDTTERNAGMLRVPLVVSLVELPTSGRR
jgi:hypothetical protein